MTASPQVCDAILVQGDGTTPDCLTIGSIACPQPQEGEVLIKVAAAGVNGADILQRQGLYPPPPDASDIMGLEAAGTVAALGKGVISLTVGTRVCAILTGGGYAAYCTAPAVQCLPIPKGWSESEAACIPETFFTAWSNLIDRAHLTEGKSVLIHGGAGGVGTAAIQIARATKARTIIATARGDEKCQFCRQLGAHHAIDYEQHDFVANLKDITQGAGVDVILDSVGGDYVARNIRCLAKDGKLVHIAFRKGSEVTLNLMPMMLKRLTLTGSTLRIRPPSFKGAIATAVRENLWHHLEARAINPCLDVTFPLAQAGRAHERMEKSLHKGKIILTL